MGRWKARIGRATDTPVRAFDPPSPSGRGPGRGRKGRANPWQPGSRAAFLLTLTLSLRERSHDPLRLTKCAPGPDGGIVRATASWTACGLPPLSSRHGLRQPVGCSRALGPHRKRQLRRRTKTSRKTNGSWVGREGAAAHGLRRLRFVRSVPFCSKNGSGRGSRLPEQPGGLPAISRGSRSAERDDTPGRRTPSEASWRDASDILMPEVGPSHPSGVRWFGISGGVAVLTPG